jgi:amino acid transporter
MIGIGWITVVGAWITRAGPLGAVGGFAFGGVVMAGVAACYAELTGMMPRSGGDVVFADRVFGRSASFFVGWFLVLMAMSVAAFEALSFVWVATTLAPQLGSTRLYTMLGEVVTVQQVIIGVGVLVAMYVVNRVGVNASSRAQDALTIFKLIVMSAFIISAVAFGDPARLLQESAASHTLDSHITGGLWIAATCAFWLGGFQVISQAAEERDQRTSLLTIGRITTGSVFIGLIFYIGVIVAVTAAAPFDTTLNAALPAATAAAAAFRSEWGAVAVLLAGMCGILATLNAMLLSGSRLSVALARFSFLPARFAIPDRRGTPAAGLTIVTLFAVVGVFAGKGLLLPVVNTASMSLIFSYLLVCAAVLRLRKCAPDAQRPFRIPGPIALIWLIVISVAAMAVFVVVDPALSQHGVPLEWLLFLGWGTLGTAIWYARRRIAHRGLLEDSALSR